MPQNQKTIAQLYTQLADNITGEISPEDIRDIIESLRPSFGSLYISTPVVNPIVTTGVPEKILGTTTFNALAYQFDTNSVSNRLRYTGTNTVLVFASANITCASDSDTRAFHLAKNGTVITGNKHRASGNSGDLEAVSVSTILSMVNGDYVEAFVANESTSASISVTQMTMRCFSIGPAA